VYLPLRLTVDREVVCEGLRDSTIDAIAADHAPHAPNLREWPFDDASDGMLGLETALLLAFDGAWFAGRASALADVVAGGTYRVRRGQPWWSVAVGRDADLVVIDPEATWVVDRLALVSKAHNTLY
jgi:dihydroorotase